MKKKSSNLFSFDNLIELGILNNIEFLDELSQKASGEAMIEMQIENIRKKWSELSFVVIPYNDEKGKYKLTGIDDVMVILDDHQSSVQV